MPFLVGSPVAIVSIRQHGRVLEVLPGGRYRIAVGGSTMVCDEGQLETISHAKKERRREREMPRPVADTPDPAVPYAADASRYRMIDLHGLTVPEALAVLPRFIDRAIREGLTHVEIVHGISGGKLRAAVRKFLAGVPSVTNAASDEKNPGVTIAYF
jgi:dsDNA-specific endonuclease/ATPase MutS2